MSTPNLPEKMDVCTDSVHDLPGERVAQSLSGRALSTLGEALIRAGRMLKQRARQLPDKVSSNNFTITL
ncbi:MAG: hypothetical protein JW726_16695 [Anaerolineales bacterium]|nr:hypothetical protein [Anaerolineales bacterium]